MDITADDAAGDVGMDSSFGAFDDFDDGAAGTAILVNIHISPCLELQPLPALLLSHLSRTHLVQHRYVVLHDNCNRP